MHEFVHGWDLASLARERGHRWLAGLPAGPTPGGGDNLHIISLLLYRIYTECPDYYAFRDHNNLATQCECVCVCVCVCVCTHYFEKNVIFTFINLFY